ncbi:MAG: hypothetical protein AAF088_02600 [Pseudomonadota bacterium]
MAGKYHDREDGRTHPVLGEGDREKGEPSFDQKRGEVHATLR